jgi:hypothetical protein
MTAPYRFDRYKNGTKMAEGIKVTKESCFFDAIKVAARLADPGDVLVYDADVSDALVASAREEALREAAAICNQSYGGSIGDVHKAILALIEKDKTDG